MRSRKPASRSGCCSAIQSENRGLTPARNDPRLFEYFDPVFAAIQSVYRAFVISNQGRVFGLPRVLPGTNSSGRAASLFR